MALFMLVMTGSLALWVTVDQRGLPGWTLPVLWINFGWTARLWWPILLDEWRRWRDGD